jgi:hypothetical protein
MILLKATWTFFSTATDDDGNYVDSIYSWDLYEFDEVTRTVTHTPGTQQSFPSQPADFSYDPALEFFVYTTGSTRIAYFHDGSGGFTTKELTVRITATGSNCFGESMVQLLAVVTGDYAGPFTYHWTDANASTAIGIGPVAAGPFSVTVTDTPSQASIAASLVVGQRTQVLLTLSKINNDLVADASNGQAPYTYSWQDGETTKTREATPGHFIVNVTDGNGCTAEASITVEPFRYWFSGNPIVLQLDAGAAYRANPATKPGLSFVCEVWVERAYLSDVFERVGQPLEQPADRAGRATFEVQELLEPFVAPVLPEAGQALMRRADGAFCRFYLKHYERTSAGPGALTTLEQNYLLHGGLSFTEAAVGTWFSGYQDTHHPFLTWEPTTKKVLPDQPEFLYFMVPVFDLDEFRYRLRTHFADGSLREDIVAVGLDAQRFEVFCLPAGPVALGLAAKEATAGSLATHYQLDVVDATGAPLSEARTFVLDRRPCAVRRYFMYANSLGGWNTLVCRGRASQDLVIKTSVSENAHAAGYDPLLGDYTTNRRTGLPVLKCYTGPRPAAQLVADQDFLLSERVLLLQDGRYQPGQVKDRTFTPYDEDETRRVVQFDFELPRERYHTPRLNS